jgi:hypothetical protein
MLTKIIGSLNDSLFFLNSTHLLVSCFLLGLKQNKKLSGLKIQLRFCVDEYYRELRLNDSAAEKFDSILQNVSALELILMLRHTAVGLWV